MRPLSPSTSNTKNGHLAVTVSLLVSCGLHAFLIWAGMAPSPAQIVSGPNLVWLEVQAIARGSEGTVPVSSNANSIAFAARLPSEQSKLLVSETNLDGQASGAGGGHRANSEATWNIAEVTHANLGNVPHLGDVINEVSRIRTGAERASESPDRATPNPSTDRTTSLTSGRVALRTIERLRGHSTHLQRRSQTAQAEVLEARPTASLADRLSPNNQARPSAPESSQERPNPAQQRAAVAAGSASVQTERLGRPQDRSESPSLSSRENPSDAQYSTRSSRTVGDGTGGAVRSGPTGDGHSQAEGGAASSLGNPTGTVLLSASVAEARPFLLALSRCASRHVIYPAQRRIQLDQGQTLVSIALTADGRPISAPRVLRSSGFRDFDTEATRATEACLPTSAIPQALVHGASRIEVRLPIIFENPLVE